MVSSSSSSGFAGMGLSEAVYKGIVTRMGFRNPTPVQRKAIPVILSGVVDVCVMARTGSGKTAAFCIPLLEALLKDSGEDQSTATTTLEKPKGVQAIILSPTRELSVQTLKVLQKMAHYCPPHLCKSIGIHGGEGMEHQFHLLASHPQIIVATPGRLAHHVTEIPDFTLDQVKMCILDEADRMMELGFAPQIRQIAHALPPNAQKVLLSATLPQSLLEFTKTSGFFLQEQPHLVRLDSEVTVAADLRMAFVTCRSLEKDAALLQILDVLQEDDLQDQGEPSKTSNAATTGRTLIFCATRHHVEYVTHLIQSHFGGLAASATHMATMIYGSMDSQARNHNLAAFRNGQTPIMVVTDVAARGIDIPHLDHVIHYHFPPSPKLFVHRSGRVARAGRIGYAWGLVDPEEMPYLVDLHIFLGRSVEIPATASTTYEMKDMTPDMVHTGCVPEPLMTAQMERLQHQVLNSEFAGSQAAQAMQALTKVCANAMKQYRKTRPEASPASVRQAKALLEGQKDAGGQRKHQADSGISPHPLLQGIYERQMQDLQARGKITALNTQQQQRDRQDFLHAMAQFRPKETVFEAFGHGKQAAGSIVSHLDRGRTTANSKSKEGALVAMKHMRRQMKIARSKGTALVVAGSEQAQSMNGDEEGDHDVALSDEQTSEPQHNEKSVETKGAASQLQVGNGVSSKPRLSKAARRKLKKNGGLVVAAEEAKDTTSSNPKPQQQQQHDFKDPAFFISNHFSTDETPQERQRKQAMEAALQPSASHNAHYNHRLLNQQAVLEIVGDERQDLVQKHRAMRWDKSKRKYLPASEIEHNKKIRLESGQLVKKDQLKLGELYEKWQKKTNKSIGRTGVFDDEDGGGDAPVRKSKGKSAKGKGNKKSKDERADTPRSARDIQKGRARKQDNKIKNMKRGDRRKLLSSGSKKSR